MKRQPLFRAGWFVAAWFGLALLSCAVAWAQPNRESYRAPFSAWRETEPNLEVNAGDAGSSFAEQAQRSGAAAQTFLKARRQFLETQAHSADQDRWLQQPLADPRNLLSVHPEVQRLLANTGELLAGTITTFAAVKDPAIQQVRQAMERERAALNALNESLKSRGQMQGSVGTSTETTELLRATIHDRLQAADRGRASIAAHIEQESQAWTKYYATLIEGAMSTEPAAPTTAAGAKPPVSQPRVLTPKPSPAGLPLSRYTGLWKFPDKGLFFGAQPQSVELEVKEENGAMSGTLHAKFLLPAGSPGNPELTLEFQGLIQQTRNQVFPVRTSDGAAGSIELIPGSAFNLLEVNVQTDKVPNKVTSANFVLLKQ